ncbi:hypothetical protein AMTR_s00042p00143440 [Amborella trichopoda]|uniref:Pectinesterase inhibitor domain-containing protein n=1 Tax=Amborella trichopoda TaxID=13333 RepID=W1P6N5_AMBTC|nr:hypothetical protein AMTR_s00042p00143440 [Amborella trichopoda]
MDSLSFPSHLRKHPYLALILLALLITIIVAGAAGKGFHTPFSDDKEEILGDPYAILRSSCNDTLYPKLCFKTRASKSQALSGTTRSEIVGLTIKETIDSFEELHRQNLSFLQVDQTDLNFRQRGALKDCLYLIDHTLFQLYYAYYQLHHMSPKNHFNLSESHFSADKYQLLQPTPANLKILLSAAMTNQDTCLTVFGDGFMARDLTVVDTAGPTKHQAVALHVQSNFTAFLRVNISAYQDTLYAHSLHHSIGIVISTALLTSSSATHPQFQPTHDTSFIFQNCTIQGAPDLEPVKCNFSTYLGRPWRPHARMVIMQLYLGDAMGKEGWHPWGTSQCNIQRRVWSTRNGDPGLTQREG